MPKEKRVTKLMPAIGVECSVNQGCVLPFAVPRRPVWCLDRNRG
ncbi:hypothetical protein ACFLVJ_02830 [Chloroflexota bacterium]